MAVVYLAEDPKPGRKVALKVLKRDLAHAIGTELFLREVETRGLSSVTPISLPSAIRVKRRGSSTL